MVWNDKNIIKVLNSGGVAVMPTDTIYGIVGSALDVGVVERIYNARKRTPEKPCIILIGDTSDLEKFSINLSEKQKDVIKKYWIDLSESISIIFDCSDEKFAYLHRGTKTLAFRLPANLDLRNLLKKTGPLIVPSANIEGLSPAQNINGAKKYFGDAVDLYVDGGEITGKASKIVKLHKDDSIRILRE